MKRFLVAMITILLSAASVQAQSEAALKEYFEGRTVALKLPMPGTEKGVDIYPGSPRPLDYPQYADRLKDYGTAIRSGESAVVTKIKLKSKHIEFQLGGGGYGTMGDETSSDVGTGEAPKTKREKNLEAELKRETDPAKKRAMKEELDDLKSDRERENARNRSAVAEAEEHRKENIRERRLQGGSRFNIRFNENVPADALRPEAVMAALAAIRRLRQPRRQECRDQRPDPTHLEWLQLKRRTGVHRSLDHLGRTSGRDASQRHAGPGSGCSVR